MDIQRLFSHPLRLSPAEIQRETWLSLENRERYHRQSANTLVNALASLPPRPAVAMTTVESSASTDTAQAGNPHTLR
ncbi:hypothetical protein [Luteimonas sp. FCS-9]|uniref:hypothetical protein n=1 Tax=Luteimonas sp. FCS-9 TaxID=1547516 RepID=UPI00063E985F|nr:hypothetical protein [Luteimonas sp. FCS-9]KLI99280.1 hypothetical protein WQ56_12830 [Luteimonas sp. FCS-9]